MAHGITETDHMFTVRKPPWHNLGTVLSEKATAAEAIAAAKLGWTVEKAEAFYKSPNPKLGLRPAERHYFTIRADNDEVLGSVGEAYTPLQNTDAFKFMDEITRDPNGPKYVTAGSLHGGRKVWLLAKLPDFIEVTKDDYIDQYLLLSNTHDGTKQVEVLWTPVRVVCQNTLSFALRSGSKVRFKHVSSIIERVEEAQDLLGIARENGELLKEATKAMRSKEPSTAEVDRVLNTLLIAPGRISHTDQSYANIKDVGHLYRSGRANSAAGDTGSCWALYNAITEWSDHYRPVATTTASTAGGRLGSNWYGASAELKRRAFDLVLELCK